jgi:chromosome segregation ATPase
MDNTCRTASSRNSIENELTARPAPLRDRSESARNDQVQLNLANISLRTAKAQCNELKKVLAKRAAQVSSLEEQLYSANTAKENGEQLLNMQKSEIQKTQEELRRAENDLNVLRFEKEEIETSFHALRTEITDLKFRNSELRSENKRLETVMARMTDEYREERRKIMQSSRNRESMFLRQASGSAGIANAVAGPSRITLQQSQPSPANSSQISLYWNSIPREHSVHPPNQLSSKSTVATRESDDKRLREEQKELVKNIQCLFKCGVCMDEHPEDYVTLLDPCGHKFCRDCIRNHIGAKLAERYFPILCPVCMAEGGKSDPGSE